MYSFMNETSKKQIEVINSVKNKNWFRSCVGCVDFSPKDRMLSCCSHCCVNPYAICGSHDNFYSKEPRRIN